MLSGFDAVAEHYDAIERGNRVFLHLRERSFRALRAAFAPDTRLIEVGSGTGTEAEGLARRGARIALVDPSTALLALAAAKVRGVRPDALLGAHALPARSLDTLVPVYGPSWFDGGYASLGALNGEPSLEPVAAGFGRLVRPGGQLVLSVMNPVCAVELAWFGAHRDWQSASRRWRRRAAVRASAIPGGPRDVSTWYYARQEIERAFAPDFSVESSEALPLLWPPTYLDFLVERFSRLFGALAAVEPLLARLPLLRDLGDHVLIRLRRRGESRDQVRVQA
jgi:SAM-dependent methyltransferase